MEEVPLAGGSPSGLTAKQLKAEEQYQRYKEMAEGKDYSEIEALNIVHIAGVDKEGRRIAVVQAANLPAKTVDLKLLLLYFITIMDPIVDKDYTLVFIGTNLKSDNRPPSEWLSTAYTMFNRKYKKNLKALYIIHPGSLVRLVLTLVKPFISSKFWKKVTFIDNIYTIYEHISRDQITFPNSVIRFNAKKYRLVPIFGSPLPIVLKLEGNPEGLPRVVTDCMAYLRNHFHVEGLFRKSGENKVLQNLIRSYDIRENIDLSTIEDPHIVSCLLKRFLGAMPDPLFPFEYYDILLQFHRLLSQEHPEMWITKNAHVLKSFPIENFNLLKTLFEFFDELLEHSVENLMVASTLATVIGPNVLKSREPLSDLNELQEANNITELFILNHREIISQSEAMRAQITE